MTSVNNEYATQTQREIVSIIRDDLTKELAEGFPLLSTFPNSETLGVKEFFSDLAPSDQQALIDELAYYSVLPFSYELLKRKGANPLLRKFTYKQPSYGSSFMVGRPQKSALKKSLVESLTRDGFDCTKNGSSVFAHGIIGGASATVWMHFNPGGMRQFYFGVSDWMNANLVQELAPLTVKLPHPFAGELVYEVPIIAGLSYDQLWTGTPASPCNTAWDLVSEANLETSVNAFESALKRLGSIVERINVLNSRK